MKKVFNLMGVTTLALALGTFVSVASATGIPGDANGDSVVNANDTAHVLSQIGSEGVDLNDLNEVLNNMPADNGDRNNDGRVTETDTVLDTFGSDSEAGDLTNDGVVDLNDLNQALNGTVTATSAADAAAAVEFEVAQGVDYNGDGVVNADDLAWRDRQIALWNQILASTTQATTSTSTATVAIAAIEGDLNNDGVVNADDIALKDLADAIAKAAADAAYLAANDHNGDGVVNADDIAWKDRQIALQNNASTTVSTPDSETASESRRRGGSRRIASRIVASGAVLGAETFSFQTDLSFGMTGNDVTELQKRLIKDGYLKIAAPTGYFGTLTLAAVKAYQGEHGLPTTGFVGPMTRAILNK